jgi:drug/metabolite transporter (DMT)-like permease
MGALLGLLSSVMTGLSDLFGRKIVRVAGVVTGSLTLQVAAMSTALVSVLLFGGVFTARDLSIGLLSGLCMGLALGAYYRGITVSSATIVSPLVATLSAIIPFGYAMVRGSSPTALALLGSLVAIVGLVVITTGGGVVEFSVKKGLWWAAASGLAYGVAFAIVLEATDDAGPWPAVWQRVGGATVLFLAVRQRRGAALPPAGSRVSGVLAGVFAGLCSVAYIAGVRIDPTATVITGSTFPAASVAVGTLAFNDPLSRRQIVGLVVVLLGVVGVALG